MGFIVAHWGFRSGWSIVSIINALAAKDIKQRACPPTYLIF